MTTPEFHHRHLSPRRRRLRHFLLTLLPVTAGILIVLAVDGLVELARERSLAEEAQSAIKAEIAANASALDTALGSLGTLQEDLANVTTIVNDILNTGRTRVDSYSYNLDIAALSDASWQAAERTGALAYVDYGAVREYSDLYALQGRVENSRREFLPRLAKLAVVGQAMASGDPESYVRDFQDIRPAVAEAAEALAIHVALANELAGAYRNFNVSGAAAN